MAPKKSYDTPMDVFLQQRTELEQRHASSSCSCSNQPEEDSYMYERYTHGPALGVDKWGTGEIMHLGFNAEWQVIGPNTNEFKSQLGILARNGQKVPLIYFEGTDMPRDVLNYIWEEVKANTDAPDTYRSYCLRNVEKMWRDWKYRLKVKYFNGKTAEERLQIVSSRVIEEQWRTLIAYWSSEEVKALTVTNKNNRSHLSSLPRIGRTLFANMKEQIKKAGKKTDRISVFIETRSRSDGTVGDSDSAEIISQFQECLSQLSEDQQTNATRDEIFTQVMGSDGHGYVRAYGHGPSPVDVERATSSQNTGVLERKLFDLQSSYDQLQDRYGDLQTKYDRMEAFMRSNFETFGHQVPPSLSEQVLDASCAP